MQNWGKFGSLHQVETFYNSAHKTERICMRCCWCLLYFVAEIIFQTSMLILLTISSLWNKTETFFFGDGEVCAQINFS
jgi:lipopolysaccharide/colanic/teichoic acid biosynthesis glycosyltransferase